MGVDIHRHHLKRSCLHIPHTTLNHLGQCTLGQLGRQYLGGTIWAIRAGNIWAVRACLQRASRPLLMTWLNWPGRPLALIMTHPLRSTSNPGYLPLSSKSHRHKLSTRSNQKQCVATYSDSDDSEQESSNEEEEEGTEDFDLDRYYLTVPHGGHRVHRNPLQEMHP